MQAFHLEPKLDDDERDKLLFLPRGLDDDELLDLPRGLDLDKLLDLPRERG